MYRKSLATFVAMSALSAVAQFLSLAPVGARDAIDATPALWKVEGPKGDIYFFGSMHLLPKALTWRSPPLEAALKKADQLVFEIDMEQAQSEQAMGELVVKYGFLPRRESLHEMLAPEHRERLDAIATSVGLKPSTVDRMRPWFVATTLNSLGIVKQNSAPKPPSDGSGTVMTVAGADAQLWAWAKSAGKDRGVLETTEDQVRVFADLSRQDELDFLLVTLEEQKRTPQTLGSMIDAWATGDTEKLDKAFNDDLNRYPALRKAILHDRHEKWLPQIERMLADEQTHVVVVGTAHLVGDDSIIALLRAQGLTVEGP